MPDAPVYVLGIGATHLRAWCRDGILIVFGDTVDDNRLRRTVLDAVRAPVRMHRLSDIDVRRVAAERPRGRR
ncbi:hypothetical protein I1A62_02265 (plasmid) [Rhodococcus sp. USK10]|uniref:hypothetical protein n=1 Tax=unclassified Rhodococcus (in: high G+C Gram-positive bacteria) TaxID=192944 RepID=UPI001C5FACD5|nr:MULTISPECIES: hypothetical protein [unclassified Rhodococcus (in: high G+C Gram-positive bacteria)]MDF3313329.1 hypothetical protein [Rhodococcus sp. T2V]QYA99977.1 hypothetical protein I1A62_02265 [Rhodococcus sp. USK10]